MLECRSSGGTMLLRTMSLSKYFPERELGIEGKRAEVKMKISEKVNKT